MKRIAIIGAGISGLTCALRLEELRKQNNTDLEIFLYESASRAGGTIETEIRDGFTLEKGPDSFISEKPWVLDLCNKLRINSEILDTQNENRKVLIVKNGKLIALPEGFYLIAPTHLPALAATPLFSALGKIRMASEIFIPKRPSDTDESIASFIRRRFGKEALERVGQPMIAGIHSGDPERLSLLAAMPKFVELERQHGSVIRGLIKNRKNDKAMRKVSGPRYGLFLSFKNGMETLTRSICKKLPEETLHLNCRIKIEGRDALRKWVLSDQDGQTQAFDAICLSVSAKQAAALLRNVDSAFADQLDRLYFESVATLNLAYKRTQISHKLDSFGFVVPAIEKKSLMACTFASQKYRNRSPEGYVLLRAFVGGAFGKEFLQMEDKDLKEAVTHDLKTLLGISGEPSLHCMARHTNALPQYTVNHKLWLSEIEERAKKHPDLYLTGASYRGTGITNCVKDAELEADKMYKDLYEEKRSRYPSACFQ